MPTSSPLSRNLDLFILIQVKLNSGLIDIELIKKIENIYKLSFVVLVFIFIFRQTNTDSIIFLIAKTSNTINFYLREAISIVVRISNYFHTSIHYRSHHSHIVYSNISTYNNSKKLGLPSNKS
jgi:hypothetical protein